MSGDHIVPASTKVRTSRVGNIDSDRLRRRLAWLDENKARLAREIDSPDQPVGRVRLRALAREYLVIERELLRRYNGQVPGHLLTPTTGAHHDHGR